MPLPRDEKPAAHTAKDFWNLPEGDRAELIDGVLYDMAPPSWDHQQITGGIASDLRVHIKERGGLCKVCAAPVAVSLSADETTWVEPDVIVVCDPSKISHRGVEGAPDLTVEVVSLSSIERDCLTKSVLYKSAGVREYWIVDPLSERTTVYRFEAQGADFVSVYDFTQPVPVGIWNGELSLTVAEYL